VKGTFYGMQAVLPHMLQNKFGVIVNVGSMAHRRGGPGSSIHYAAAKGAVVTMTMGVAREFAAQGIRALSISPRAGEDAVPRCRRKLARIGAAVSRRRADETLRRAGGDRRIGVVHVFGRLRIHDRGHRLRERRRRLALVPAAETPKLLLEPPAMQGVGLHHVLRPSSLARKTWNAGARLFRRGRRGPDRAAVRG
jgi:NAD(P)-dependent dehydrogenase (short-subunit alcohol dehydrogenase family)